MYVIANNLSRSIKTIIIFVPTSPNYAFSLYLILLNAGDLLYTKYSNLFYSLEYLFIYNNHIHIYVTKFINQLIYLFLHVLRSILHAITN